MADAFLKTLTQLCGFDRSFLFLDPCALSATLTLIVQLGATNTTGFVQDNRLDVRREEWENPFYTDTVRDLTHGESSSIAFTLSFDHISTEGLDSLFITFNNFIIDGDVVTGFEL